MTTSQSSHRASLLAGLRTGGVRSASVPHTAGPQASFVVSPPHMNGHPHAHYAPSFPEEDEMDTLAQMMSNGAHISQHRYAQPRTANDLNSVPLARQQQYWNGATQNRVNQMSNDGYPITAYNANTQELQLQMMQMELMRLQALSQLQQYTQFRQDNQQVLPQTAYQPNIGASYQAQSGQLPVPMTAAIGGKFGRRSSYNGPFEDETNLYGSRQAPIMNQSGLVSNAILKDNSVSQNVAPSKSDTAVSWRNNSNDPVLTRDNQRRSPLPRRQRPEPLELGGVSNVVSDQETESNPGSREATESSNDSSSSKSDGDVVSSTPTTPVSGNSNGSLSVEREEASKKLFQGLGLGRPSIHVTAPSESTVPANFLGGGVPATTGTNRVVSQVIRQPRGPPASAEELSTKNFANRIRKKAIGGLEALLEARERREGVPVHESY